MAPSRFELLYFPGTGRAEVARAILAYAEADWTNTFPKPDWPSIKSQQPFHKVPVLTEYEPDGTKFILAESAIIERYLAQKFGLTAETLKDRAHLDSISEHYHGLANKATPAMFGSDEKKAQALEEFKVYLKSFITIHEGLLAKNGSNGHYHGNTTTYVDITAAVLLMMTKDLVSDAISEAEAPNLSKLIATVKADEKFAKNYKPFQAP
jgi:glutathione S-transferase